MPFLNSHSDLMIASGGNLPHWFQGGKIQFVTFRLNDSLPQSVIGDLLYKRRQFEDSHPKPWDSATIVEFQNLLGPIESALLDKGYGSCILKDPRYRQIVTDAIRYFDGIRYVCLAYVVMPNHVHLLIVEKAEFPLKTIISSIKRYSANRINEVRRGEGNIWMGNYFDRIIRTPHHYRYCLDYIYNNPRYLEKEEFELYVHEEAYRYCLL